MSATDDTAALRYALDHHASILYVWHQLHCKLKFAVTWLVRVPVAKLS